MGTWFILSTPNRSRQSIDVNVDADVKLGSGRGSVGGGRDVEDGDGAHRAGNRGVGGRGRQLDNAAVEAGVVD